MELIHPLGHGKQTVGVSASLKNLHIFREEVKNKSATPLKSLMIKKKLLALEELFKTI